MAVDTRDRRLSVLEYGLPLGRPLPTPDATVVAPERRSIAWLYAGLTLLQNWSLRASMISLTLPTARPGLYPDGVVSATDRQYLRGLYGHIAVAGPGGAVLTISHTIGRALMRALGRGF